MPESVDSVWFILDKIQKDIDRIEDKQDSHLISSTKLAAQLDNIGSKVSEINKLLTLDNGKPSIVSQLNELSAQINTTAADVVETKSLVSKLSSEVTAVQQQLGVRTPKEVSVERWKTVGLLGGGFLAVLPGILSFIHSFF